ncbi:MAG: hypothetical protein U9P90_03670 [Patescibacteria group bacterium]|nr:hypothetical protein [Patescibacteria group bacterium]
MRWVIIAFVVLCSCSVSRRINFGEDFSDRVETIKGLSRVYIIAYKNNEIAVTYTHYLPFDTEASRHSACVQFAVPVEDRPGALHNICVDSRRRVVKIFVGTNDGVTETYTCLDEKNRRMCLLMQYRFDWIYEDLEVERRITEALYPDQTEIEDKDSEE